MFKNLKFFTRKTNYHPVRLTNLSCVPQPENLMLTSIDPVEVVLRDFEISLVADGVRRQPVAQGTIEYMGE